MDVVKTKPLIVKEILQSLKEKFEEERQVILNCYYRPQTEYDMIRIWPSTFLLDNDSSHVSNLIHTENISLFPIWTEVPFGGYFHFTLIFTGLPKACKSFDFAELIPEANGFYVENIIRNKTDIYNVKIV